MRPKPSVLAPALPIERLRQRAILAAHRAESLQLDRPEDVLLFPVGGRRLTADLEAAAASLSSRSQTRPRLDRPRLLEPGRDSGGPASASGEAQDAATRRTGSLAAIAPGPT